MMQMRAESEWELGSERLNHGRRRLRSSIEIDLGSRALFQNGYIDHPSIGTATDDRSHTIKDDGRGTIEEKVSES